MMITLWRWLTGTSADYFVIDNERRSMSIDYQRKDYYNDGGR